MSTSPPTALHDLKCVGDCVSTAALDSVWVYPVLGLLIAVIWLVGRILWRRSKAVKTRD